MEQNKNEVNGWKNQSTYNVVNWLNNDEFIYNAAVKYMKAHPESKKPYSNFIRSMQMQDEKTPDGIKWISRLLDYASLNEMMRELR